MCSLVVHINDPLILQFTGYLPWRHLTDMQIRLKGKNMKTSWSENNAHRASFWFPHDATEMQNYCKFLQYKGKLSMIISEITAPNDSFLELYIFEAVGISYEILSSIFGVETGRLITIQ